MRCILISNKMTFQVCYVSKNYESNLNLEEMCRYLGIQYSERDYNSSIYSVDRDYIERLPAFHVFEGRHHTGTYYPDKDIDKLELLLTNYNIRQMKRKNSSWKRILRHFLKTDSKSSRKYVVDKLTTRT